MFQQGKEGNDMTATSNLTCKQLKEIAEILHEVDFVSVSEVLNLPKHKTNVEIYEELKNSKEK
jgi:hypothetical protein